MYYAVHFWCLVSIVISCTLSIVSNQEHRSFKKPKVLVLIIASDQYPVYIELQKIWRSYMHIDSENIEAYFIKSNPALSVLCLQEDDIIWSKTTEGWVPTSSAIIDNTILSIELLLPRIISEFDYVVRTNLSSFFIFPRLLNFLADAPPNNFYCGPWIGDDYIAEGSGIVVSKDLVQKLIEHKEEFIHNIAAADDTLIGNFFKHHSISAHLRCRCDFLTMQTWQEHKNALQESTFHIRVKNDNPDLRLTDDIAIMKELVHRFYGIDLNNKLSHSNLKEHSL